MRIASSSVELASTQVSSLVSKRRESLAFWVGDEPPDRPPATSAASREPSGAGERALSPALTAARARASILERASPKEVAPSRDAGSGGAASDEEGQAQMTSRDQLALAILQRHFHLRHGLTRSAQEVRKAYADGAQAAAQTQAATHQASGTGGPPAAPQKAGWGLRYDAIQTTATTEGTTFSARAQVSTADGRTIQVQAGLALERSQVDTSEVHVRAGDAAKVDPLVLNLVGGAATFDGTSQLDLNGDGVPETVAALGAGSAYLALDRNGNGFVDSGAELFGPSTGSGFGELSALDQDQNGWLDEADGAFGQLSVWSPASGTLSPLAAAHVGAIYTGSVATPFDVKGAGGALQGTIAETGLFLREDGTAGTVQHVDLAV